MTRYGRLNRLEQQLDQQEPVRMAFIADEGTLWLLIGSSWKPAPDGMTLADIPHAKVYGFDPRDITEGESPN